MTRTRWYPVMLIVGLCLAATASAQSTATPDTARVAPASSVAADSSTNGGPRVASLATGIHRTVADERSLEQRSRQPQSVGKPMATMIVGGAAIVLGAVIGDDVGTLFMIGGTVALLIGLYQYLQ